MSEIKGESELRFELPQLTESADGWGPSGVVARYQSVPFAPFNKGDKIGRVSDWNATAYPTRTGREQQRFASSSVFNYKAEEDENTFSLVDTKVKSKTRKPFRRPFNTNTRGRGRNTNNRGGSSNRRGGMRQGTRRFGQQNWQQDIKEASIVAQDDWKLLEEIDMEEDVSGLVFSQKTQPQDITSAGALDQYKDTLDQLSPNNPSSLTRYNRTVYTTTTSQDPIMEDLIKNKAGTVYATDVILSVLMTAPFSKVSWDLIIKKDDQSIVIDKRASSRIDFLTVNENWNEVQVNDKDSINHPLGLSDEATRINHNFSQFVLNQKEQVKFERPNPFSEDAQAQQTEIASSAYRYRKWEVDQVPVVVRCELNAFSVRKGAESDKDKVYLSVKALNEFDPKVSGNVSWRQSLNSQLGAVLATEMKSNMNKLARWSAQSLLSGAETLKLGFVSRVNPKDPNSHVVLKVQSYKCSQFLTQLSVTERNLWGNLRYFIDKFSKLENGKYVLVKDPNKPELRLYALPANWEDDEDDQE